MSRPTGTGSQQEWLTWLLRDLERAVTYRQVALRRLERMKGVEWAYLEARREGLRALIVELGRVQVELVARTLELTAEGRALLAAAGP